MAKHWVEFMQFGCTLFQHLNANASCSCNLGKFAFLMRQKFVQRRVKQADRNRQPSHHFKNRCKILALFRQQFVERNTAPLFIVSQYHLAHGSDAACVKEHMLRPAQANALRAEIARGLRIGRRFGVGADLHPAARIRPDHQRPEITYQFGLDRRHFARHNFAGGAIQRDDIALIQRAASNAQHFGSSINLNASCTRYAWTPHATCDHRSMAGHPTARGQYALGGMHAVNVFGACFNTHQNDGLAHVIETFGGVGIEHDLARCCTR